MKRLLRSAYRIIVAPRASAAPFMFLRRATGLVILGRNVEFWLGGGIDLVAGPRSLLGPPAVVPWPEAIVAAWGCLTLASAVGLLRGSGILSPLVSLLAHFVGTCVLGSSTYGLDSVLAFTLAVLVVAGGGNATRGAWMALLALRVAVSVLYLSSGLEKASGPDWWTGRSISDALARPDLATLEAVRNISRGPAWILACLSVGTVALELGYPLLLGWRRTRRMGVAGVVSLHLGIALFLGLPWFSLQMVALSLAAWIIPATRRRPIAIFDVGCRRCGQLVQGLANWSGDRFEAVAHTDPRAAGLAVDVDLSREMAFVDGRCVRAGSEAFLATLACGLFVGERGQRWAAQLGRTRVAKRAYAAYASRRCSGRTCLTN